MLLMLVACGTAGRAAAPAADGGVAVDAAAVAVDAGAGPAIQAIGVGDRRRCARAESG